MAMDDLRVGQLARALRHRLGWTQAEVGRRAGVSQTLVSLFERGKFEQLTVRSTRRIASVLEMRLPFDPRWRGGDGARLLDAAHAGLVNEVVAMLRGAGWEVLVEYTFNHYGERGSVDIVGWHPRRGCLLVVEVKSRLLDVQATIAALHRKVRVVRRLLADERGWVAESVGVVLVAEEMTANRSIVARHRDIFGASFPDRGWAVRRWLRRPAGALSAVWFLRPSNRVTGTHAPSGRKRVRQRPPRSDRLKASA